MNDASHKRWRGRLDVARRTVWTLDVRGRRFRCLARVTVGHDLQCFDGGKWQTILSKDGYAPRRLLEVVLAIPSLQI